MASGYGQHDVFDVWASIVIPAVFGLGTVLISVVSLVVARRALTVSQAVAHRDAERHHDAQRRERHEVGPLFKRVFRESVYLNTLRDSEFRNASKSETANASELENRLRGLPDKRGQRLSEWLFAEVIRLRNEDTFTVFNATFAGESLIDEWIDNPYSVDIIFASDNAARGLEDM